MKLNLWKGLLWQPTTGGIFVYCPEHRIKLDLSDGVNEYSQDISYTDDRYLVCPDDGKRFPLEGIDLATLRRRFNSVLEAVNFKDAEIVSLDGYQVPIAKVDAPKDNEYWVQARINDTKQGKQLVVYAGKRGDRDKAQMFLDVENDKLTFDQNNMHPNDVFVKVIAEFRSGRSVTMEM
jgi:hypothetical protein